MRTAAAKAVAEFMDWVREHREWDGVERKVKMELPSIIAAETSTVIQAEYRR